MKNILIIILLFVLPGLVVAQGTYQTPEQFIASVFTGDKPMNKKLWITASLKPAINAILGHDLDALRLRYWGAGQRSAWILEEVGKEKPITVGIVVNAGRIEVIRVLVFRESRGWEVKHDFFTRQFIAASLHSDNTLSKPIDGISGATLSVRALKRLATLALYLHQQTPYHQ